MNTMDQTYTTYSFENGTTAVIVNPNMEGEYLFHEGNLAAEMLMAVCQESNFGIPIRIDIPEDALQVEQQQEVVEETQVHTLDFNLIEAEDEAEVEHSQIPASSSTSANDNVVKNLRKRRSKPVDPYYDLLAQMRRDTNRVHLNFQRQGDRICRLMSDLTETINNNKTLVLRAKR